MKWANPFFVVGVLAALCLFCLGFIMLSVDAGFKRMAGAEYWRDE